MKKNRIGLAAVLILVVSAIAVSCWRTTTRGKLPWSARNVYVYSRTYGTQGWDYYLKAQLPEKDVSTFVARLGLSHCRDNPSLVGDIDWRGKRTEELYWWNPTLITTNTYLCSNGMGLDILKYENGHVYFKSTGN